MRSGQRTWGLSRSLIVLFLVAAVGFVGCDETPIPKPRGYFRLDLPEAAYTAYQGACPFRAEIPTYAVALEKPVATPAAADTACYLTLRFPGQRASVYMTCRGIANDLPELIDDAHEFKNKHEVKAARIRSERLLRDSAQVFGNLFDVEGDVASPFVFYLTDSTTHFIYGSLYFDARPNADSLQPVTERIRADMRHFANSLVWE